MRLTKVPRYERKYQEALLLVRERFTVGQPYRDEQGNRVCVVSNTLLGFDYDVFMLAWGKAVAEDLISAHVTANAVRTVA
jgi:hypothetical protein